MSELLTQQYLNQFAGILEHWQKTLPGSLTVLSVDGRILAGNNYKPGYNWTDILGTASQTNKSSFYYKDIPILVVPLIYNNETLAHLLAINATDQESTLLHWVADNIITHLTDTIALENMADELIGAWNQLALIFRVIQNTAITSDLFATLETILQETKKVVNTKAGFILFKEHNNLKYIPCSQELAGYFDTSLLFNSLMEADEVVLCTSRSECQQFWPDIPNFVTSMLSIKLPTTEDTQAVLTLINKIEKDFTAGDVKLLTTLAQQVGVIIKNFLLHQHLIYEERVSRELEIAAEIQKSLLPTQLPQLGGLSIAVSSVPASEVGGDFYDFVTLDDRHLTIIIGDVAGKGVPAAMLTSVTRTMLRVEAMRGEAPHVIIQQANNVLYQDLSRAESFVTVVVATLDTYTGTLSYASAGHPPIILWRAETRTTELLKATSPPIGIMGFQNDTLYSTPIKSGDTILFYTDGITEAQAPNGALFGLNRLLYIMKNRVGESPEQIQNYIQAEVASFRRDSFSRDDATLMVLKLLPQTGQTAPKDISTPLQTVKFSYPADIQYLSHISKQVTSVCQQLPALSLCGPSADDFIYLIELAISEICTNVIKHAYVKSRGNITGSITLLNNGVQLDIYDQGESFDPNSIPQPKVDPNHLVEGGYGLHIVRQIMDVVSYKQHPEHGNHWHLIKFLPSA